MWLGQIQCFKGLRGARAFRAAWLAHAVSGDGDVRVAQNYPYSILTKGVPQMRNTPFERLHTAHSGMSDSKLTECCLLGG